MNHNHYEELILLDNQDPSRENEALDQHLRQCTQCQALQNSIKGVGQLFRQDEFVSPAPGFVNRWETRLAIEVKSEKIVKQRWQSLLMLIAIFNAASITLIIFGQQFLNSLDAPSQFILPIIYRITTTLTFITTLQNAGFTIYRTMISVIPPGMWIFLVVGLIGACSVWLFSMKALSTVQRKA